MQKMIWLVGLLLAFAMQCGVAAAGDDKNDCYPGNGVLLTAGPTFASGEAEQKIEEIEVDHHGVFTTYTPVGGIGVEVEFNAKITGLNTMANNGTSTGRVKIDIHWKSPITGGIEETEFESGCVEEIQTEAGGSFEGEYEGTVQNFPGYPGTSKAAVATVQVVEDATNPKLKELDVTIELGYTCFENVYGGGDIEFEKIALTGLDPEDFKINKVGDHGRRSLPDLQTNTSCPED